MRKKQHGATIKNQLLEPSTEICMKFNMVPFNVLIIVGFTLCHIRIEPTIEHISNNVLRAFPQQDQVTFGDLAEQGNT